MLLPCCCRFWKKWQAGKRRRSTISLKATAFWCVNGRGPAQTGSLCAQPRVSTPTRRRIERPLKYVAECTGLDGNRIFCQLIFLQKGGSAACHPGVRCRVVDHLRIGDPLRSRRRLKPDGRRRRGLHVTAAGTGQESKQ